MPSEEQISISKLRLDIAKERLSYADEILKIGDYKTVANRSYYAVFSAMRTPPLQGTANTRQRTVNITKIYW